MRVVLNLKHLLENKLITSSEASRFKSLSMKATFQFAVSLLMVFGFLTIAAGTFAMKPSDEMMTLIGVVMLGLGIVFGRVKGEYSWCFVSFITLVLGAFLTAKGISTEFANIEIAALVSALLFILVAVVANSGFLTVLSAFTVASVVGGATEYGFNASYLLGLESRTLAILVFVILGFFTFQLSKKLKPAGSRIALIFSRTSLVIINVAFWAGSILGDTVGRINYETMLEADYDKFATAYDALLPSWFNGAVVYSPNFFALTWAVAIVLIGIWGVRKNSAFVLNTVTVFAALHFYTQWFERFGTDSWSLLTAGGVAVLIAFGLSFINEEKPARITSLPTPTKATPTVANVVAKKTTKKKPAKKAVAKKTATKKVVKKVAAKKTVVKKTTKRKVVKKAVVKKVAKKK